MTLKDEIPVYRTVNAVPDGKPVRPSLAVIVTIAVVGIVAKMGAGCDDWGGVANRNGSPKLITSGCTDDGLDAIGLRSTG